MLIETVRKIVEFFKGKKELKPCQIARVEIKIHEISLEETAQEFFQIQRENQQLREQLKQFNKDFDLRVGLEVELQTSMLAEENYRLRHQIFELQQQIENRR